NFEKHFNQAFGVIKQETFHVEVALTGYAAAFAKERRLSPDQKVEQKKDGIVLTFTSASEPEVVAWVLSFGAEAKVLSPDWLVEEIRKTAAAVGGLYA
ncbi:MAG: helix-turn-helix transcriptional regulator, partial [Thermodesulfobacteriota bacterium]